MKRIPIGSSAVSSVGYDDASRRLEVEFRGGGLYAYDGVTRAEFRGLLLAPSIGGYVNGLKTRHPFRVLKRSPPPRD